MRASATVVRQPDGSLPSQAEVDAAMLASQQRIQTGDYWQVEKGLDGGLPLEDIRLNFNRLREKPEIFMAQLASQFKQLDAQAVHEAEVKAKIAADYAAMSPEQQAANKEHQANWRYEQWLLRQTPEFLERHLRNPPPDPRDATPENE